MFRATKKPSLKRKKVSSYQRVKLPSYRYTKAAKVSSYQGIKLLKHQVKRHKVQRFYVNKVPAELPWP